MCRVFLKSCVCGTASLPNILLVLILTTNFIYASSFLNCLSWLLDFPITTEMYYSRHYWIYTLFSFKRYASDSNLFLFLIIKVFIKMADGPLFFFWRCVVSKSLLSFTLIFTLKMLNELKRWYLICMRCYEFSSK